MQTTNLKTTLSQEEQNVLEAWDSHLSGTTDNITGDKKNGIFNAVVIIAAHLSIYHENIPSVILGIDVNETLWQLKQTYDFFDWIEVLDHEPEIPAK